MKPSEAAEVVMVLMGAYAQAKTNEATSRVYETMLADLDASVARAAVNRLITTSRFLPTVAEIREACAAQKAGHRKTGAEAYEELKLAVAKHGGTPRTYWVNGEMRTQKPWPPVSPDVAQAMRQTWGSWSECCSDREIEGPSRARFIEAYETLATRERQDQVAGARLPAPQSAAPPRMREPAQQKPAPSGPLPTVTRAQPKALPPPREPRKWSAAEIDAELARAR